MIITRKLRRQTTIANEPRGRMSACPFTKNTECKFAWCNADRCYLRDFATTPAPERAADPIPALEQHPLFELRWFVYSSTCARLEMRWRRTEQSPWSDWAEPPSIRENEPLMDDDDPGKGIMDVLRRDIGAPSADTYNPDDIWSKAHAPDRLAERERAAPLNPCRRPGQCVDAGLGPAECQDCNPKPT